ncbi:MAG: gliding motility-associated C-terminal domain-containing protein [Siphonobacter sp.]
MKKIYLTLFCLYALATRATHIVGGEIQLEALKNSTTGATHRFTLNLYFDDINGNVGANDLTVLISVFRKRDNVRMGDLEMPRVYNEIIPYTNPLCANATASLRTRLIRYSSDVIFQQNVFNDSQGYYVVWERCCRNNIITNISRPQEAGSVFYLEFPALYQNNQNYTNSSPQFATVKGDYICMNQPFTFDFSATDLDGDSLRYSLVTPYNGYSTPVTPRPVATGSSAYPNITWLPGYSATNAIHGNPPLTIDPLTGKLSVVANELGLFVFSVMVEEYRAGKKIGLVRRDFQLKVLDCPQSNPPQVLAREKGKMAFYESSEIIRVLNNQERCLDLFLTQQTANSRLTIKVNPLIPKTLPFTLLPTEVLIKNSGDTVKAQLCLQECAESFDGRPLQFQVIVTDESCPLPQQDTLTISIYVEPRPNQKPTISTTLPNNQATINYGDSLRFMVNGLDLDPDSIRLEAKGRGFDMTSVEMTFTPSSGLGKATSPFSWTPPCPAVRKEPYLVDFYVIDTRCGHNTIDSLTVSIRVNGRDNQSPTVSTTLANNAATLTLEGVTGQSITFDVNAIDPDNDPITLIGRGRGFDLSSAGMSWTDRSGIGSASGPFTWTPTCEMLEGLSEKTFTVDFITEDNSCNLNRFDTVTVTLTLKDRVVATHDFTPPNVFTPNDDGKNDTFMIENMPLDNCIERFEFVEIYNRWGKPVYRDTNRDFKWAGKHFPAGQYYYTLHFTKHTYKGIITLLR